jgi:hypothetical protein
VTKLDLRDGPDGVRLRVRVKPRASKSRLVGEREGELEVAVAAPPVDGEANAELVAFLAKVLGVSKSHVAVVSGPGSRHKIVSVSGLSSSDVLRALSPGDGQ